MPNVAQAPTQGQVEKHPAAVFMVSGPSDEKVVDWHDFVGHDTEVQAEAHFEQLVEWANKDLKKHKNDLWFVLFCIPDTATMAVSRTTVVANDLTDDIDGFVREYVLDKVADDPKVLYRASRQIAKKSSSKKGAAKKPAKADVKKRAPRAAAAAAAPKQDTPEPKRAKKAAKAPADKGKGQGKADKAAPQARAKDLRQRIAAKQDDKGKGKASSTKAAPAPKAKGRKARVAVKPA